MMLDCTLSVLLHMFCTSCTIPFLMVCVQCLLYAVVLLHRKFHATHYLREFNIIVLGCHKLMVCAKFFWSTIVLLRCKFHAACHLREMGTIALHLNKLTMHVNFSFHAIALQRRKFHAACYLHELHIVLGCHKLMVCVKFSSHATVLLRRSASNFMLHAIFANWTLLHYILTSRCMLIFCCVLLCGCAANVIFNYNN